MLTKLKNAILFILDPPTDREPPETFSLAVPDAQSTFKRGAVGWAKRPPATFRCPSCGSEIDHEYANDVVRCPTCRFEHSPEAVGELALLALTCPHCESELDHGIRHPEIFDIPEWAACRRCQYHWELEHF